MSKFCTEGLPTKSDFLLTDKIIENKIKSAYLSEYKAWMNSGSPGSYITVRPDLPYYMITDFQKLAIIEMFKDLGFAEDDIRICKQLADNPNKLYIRLIIF